MNNIKIDCSNPKLDLECLWAIFEGKYFSINDKLYSIQSVQFRIRYCYCKVVFYKIDYKNHDNTMNEKH